MPRASTVGYALLAAGGPASGMVLLGCGSEDPPAASDDDTAADDDTPEVEIRADIAGPSSGWLRGDLHFHTNYSGDALEQGGDWMAGALAIADAWRAPDWVDVHPELSPDDHLQFVAVTDHRTDAGLSDPDFVHDYLVLLPGEEFGSDGHAGIWGIETHVPHEPQGGESAGERIADCIAEAHAQGALFSVNHPASDGDLWSWSIDGIDAVEVWNGPWSVLAAETTEEMLDQWIAERGGENEVIRAAVRRRGVGVNGQAVRFWEAVLSTGRHVAPVGGGDRHMLFPAGMPTTYVRAPSRDEAGVLAGIAAGETFVSRSPQGPQVVLEATVDGASFPMGATLPYTDAVDLTWAVARAPGGVLRLVGGAVDDSLPDPSVLAEIDIAGDEAAGTVTWHPPERGGWVYPVVLEPLPAEVPETLAGAVDGLLAFPEDSGIEAVLTAVLPLADLEPLGDPSSCRPALWEPARFQCMPVDTEPLGTFYIPPELQPWMSVEFEGGVATGRTMGAIGAAFLVPAP